MFSRHKSKISQKGVVMETENVLLTCLLICILIAPPVLAQEPMYKSFPVPIRIDFGYCVESSLYIKCKSKDYESTFTQFLSQESGPRESAFQELVLALREKNLPACLQLTFREPLLSEKETLEYNKHIEEMMNRFSKFFDSSLLGENFEKLRITNQFFIGTEALFICGVDSPSSVSSEPFRTVYKFEANAENEFLWKPIDGRPSALTILLRESVERRVKSPERFQAIENATFDYKFPIPGTIEGDAAYLQFNGKVYDCNIFEDSVDPSDKIMSFYQRAYHVLRDKSIEDFVQFYTSKSREKYMEWLTGKNKDYAKWYHEDLLQSGLKVVFILDAKPFYFVFYRKNHTRDKAIRFADVVLDPTDNKLKLTNFYYFDHVHEFLNSKELFINPMLKPLIKDKLK